MNWLIVSLAQKHKGKNGIRKIGVRFLPKKKKKSKRVDRRGTWPGQYAVQFDPIYTAK